MPQKVLDFIRTKCSLALFLAGNPDLARLKRWVADFALFLMLLRSLNQPVVTIVLELLAP